MVIEKGGMLINSARKKQKSKKLFDLKKISKILRI